MRKPSFLVFALPRSRTTWLSKFLAYGAWKCGHDEARHIRSLNDIQSWFSQPCTGSVETAAAPFWRLIHKNFPECRIAVIRRPVKDVTDSLMRVNPAFDAASIERTMRYLDRKLEQIERRMPDVLSVAFADLDDESVAGGLFSHCLCQPMDGGWFKATAPINVQTDMEELTRYYIAHRPQIEKIAKIAKQKMLAEMAAPFDIDGMTYQQEPFDAFYADATALFRGHLMETDQAPDAYLRKNVPLLQTLDRIGALSITTGRSNGRMFGYLMNVISPSLDDPSVLCATNAIFYASPDIPGLGMKLQRAAMSYLKSCGIGEVFMRAGIRGPGQRLQAMYRRLGADDFGQLYRLQLGA